MTPMRNMRPASLLFVVYSCYPPGPPESAPVDGSRGIVRPEWSCSEDSPYNHNSSVNGRQASYYSTLSIHRGTDNPVAARLRPSPPASGGRGPLTRLAMWRHPRRSTY
ncbi:Uncharacterised protein [Mycobacteroides abscessus subsp. abscessus]|nr:Uncharacterised protein [Mycobacteroides abscessus subsp. abscessus]